MTQKSTTIVRLSRAIECDGRMVDSVAFAGAPGGETLPVSEADGEYELDALLMLNVMAHRTGLSRTALERLSAVDFMALTLAMFMPRRDAQIVSLEDRRKAKK